MTDQPKEASAPFKCVVSADLFRRAYLAVSRDHYRAKLNGVYVSSCSEGGAQLVATDGHILVALRDPRGIVEGDGIVSLSGKMLALLRERRDDGKSRWGAMSERVVAAWHSGLCSEALAVVALSGRLHKKDGIETEPRDEVLETVRRFDRSILGFQADGAVIDGPYVDYQRVIPSKMLPQERIGPFSPALLSRLAEALCDTPTEGVMVLPSSASPNDPLSVLPLRKGVRQIDGLGVIMPMRWDETVPKAPSWLAAAE